MIATGNVSILEVASALAASNSPPLTENFLRCVPQNQPAVVNSQPLRLEGQQVHLD